MNQYSDIKALKTYFRQLAHAQLPYHWLESLLLFVLKKDKVFLMIHDDYVLNNEESQQLFDGIHQMQSGKPLAYVIGRQGFFGREFLVNEHTLIPRADTEILIDAVLTHARQQPTIGRLLDLGTGSGCIAITLAKELPNAHIIAVDSSKDALEVAQHNAHLLKAENCQFIHSSWYDHVQGSFDVIVSNPPYINKEDEHLAYLSHEPITALVADHQGLADISHIIGHATHHLNVNGLLAIEHGYDQREAVQTLFRQANFTQIATIKDYGGNDRVTWGIIK